MITSFTFDTGMLIALERRKAHAEKALRDVARRRHIPVVPAVVFAEWWRGRTDHREELLSMVRIEPMTPRLCRATGEAIAAVPGATLVDAAVMASASLRGGGVVYTADRDDLSKLGAHFPLIMLLDV